MQCLFGEISEDMAVRRETKEEIAQEVKAQLSLAIQALKPKGLKKILYWMREWGTTSIVVTVPVMLLGVALAAVYVAVGEVKQNAEFRGKTDQRLIRIESFMAFSQASLNPRKVLGDIESVDQKAFSQFLPALRKIAEQPVADVRPTQPTLQQIAGKLRQTDQSSPDYWPTVLQFINFASAGLSPNVPPPGTAGILVEGERHTLNLQGQVIKLAGGSIINSELRNCRIIFTDKPVRMNNVLFINCVFEIPVTDSPNPYLMDASRQILASNLTSVSIASLSS